MGYHLELGLCVKGEICDLLGTNCKNCAEFFYYDGLIKQCVLECSNSTYFKDFDNKECV